MAAQPKRCLLCWSEQVLSTIIDDRTTIIACLICRALIKVEMDPADEPALKDRIDVLMPPLKQPTIH